MGSGGTKNASTKASKAMCKAAIRGTDCASDLEEQIKAEFAKWDQDGSGRISKKELADLLAGLKLGLSKAEIDMVFKDADADKDDGICYEEMVNWIFRAPHLDEYFRVSREILQQATQEAEQLFASVLQPPQESGSAISTSQVQQFGVKLAKIKRLHKQKMDKTITPLIKKSFAWHDKNETGVMEYEEAIVFFSNYVALLEDFLPETIRASLTFSTSLDFSEVPSHKSLEEEIATQVQQRSDDYKIAKDAKHKAAFDFLDVHKDQKLRQGVVVEALLHGHEANEKFISALGLRIDPKDLLAAAAVRGSSAERTAC